MTILTWHYDNGHEWLEVPFAVLAAEGFQLGDFSRYSFVNAGRAYLEGDMDAAKFLDRAGGRYSTVEMNDGLKSPIRSYQRIEHAAEPQTWGVWCMVSGGVTGSRVAWLKHDGVDCVFKTREAAEAEAARLKATNGSNPFRTANFSYVARAR